jgi:hypothetical protein
MVVLFEQYGNLFRDCDALEGNYFKIFLWKKNGIVYFRCVLHCLMIQNN